MKKEISVFTAALAVLIACSNTSCTNAPKSAENSISSNRKKTIILAIDGGGIKGVMPAFILDSIEKITKYQCYQLFDIIGGTSTGGIISTGLVSKNPVTSLPYSASYVYDFYRTQGARIFVSQPKDSADAAAYYSNLGGVIGIEPVLQKMLGDRTTLSASQQYIKSLPLHRVKQLFTTGYIVNSRGVVVSNPVNGIDYGPYLFNWYDAANGRGDNYFVWEAARATSAAPTYFPIAHVGDPAGVPRSVGLERWVVDGGVMSNNPAIWAISEALRTGVATSLKDIVVISLGTGIYKGEAGVGIHNNTVYHGKYNPLPDVPANGNWGKAVWVTEPGMYDLQGQQQLYPGLVLSIFSNAVQLVPNKQIQGMQKAGLQYYRLEPVINNSQTAMDNISTANINSLVNTVRAYISSGPGAAAFKQITDSLKAKVW